MDASFPKIKTVLALFNGTTTALVYDRVYERIKEKPFTVGIWLRIERKRAKETRFFLIFSLLFLIPAVVSILFIPDYICLFSKSFKPSIRIDPKLIIGFLTAITDGHHVIVAEFISTWIRRVRSNQVPDVLDSSAGKWSRRLVNTYEAVRILKLIVRAKM